MSDLLLGGLGPLLHPTAHSPLTTLCGQQQGWLQALAQQVDAQDVMLAVLVANWALSLQLCTLLWHCCCCCCCRGGCMCG